MHKMSQKQWDAMLAGARMYTACRTVSQPGVQCIPTDGWPPALDYTHHPPPSPLPPPRAAVHCTAPFRLIQAAAPHMREAAKREIRTAGRARPRCILNVSSVSGALCCRCCRYRLGSQQPIAQQGVHLWSEAAWLHRCEHTSPPSLVPPAAVHSPAQGCTAAWVRPTMPPPRRGWWG